MIGEILSTFPSSDRPEYINFAKPEENREKDVTSGPSAPGVFVPFRRTVPPYTENRRQDAVQQTVGEAPEVSAPQRYVRREGRKDKFLAQQKWVGVVQEVKEDGFVARLETRIGGEPDYDAEFYMDEVDDEDIHLIQVGNMFYWTVGFYVTEKGQGMNSSVLRFRRIPPLSEKEIQYAKRKAESIRDELGWKD